MFVHRIPFSFAASVCYFWSLGWPDPSCIGLEHDRCKRLLLRNDYDLMAWEATLLALPNK